MNKSGLSMGERFIPSLEGWSQAQRNMFYGNYEWASQFAENKVVLDCACGSGYGSDILSKVCKRVIGADVDPEIIRYARDTFKNEKIAFNIFSAAEVPFPDDYFDLVVSFDTIEHVDDDERVFAELQRVTKGGGEIILSTPIGYYHKNHGEEELLDSTHIREYSAYEWLSILSNHFSTAEFFTRDQNFQFSRVYPGPFLGIPYDVSFVKVINMQNEKKNNMFDNVKDLVATHMTYKIKALEAELRMVEADLKTEQDKLIITRLVEKMQRYIHK